MIRCDRCHHLEAVHETYAYRGDKPRRCLVDDCACKALMTTDRNSRLLAIQRRNDYPTAEFVAHYRADIDWLLREVQELDAKVQGYVERDAGEDL